MNTRKLSVGVALLVFSCVGHAGLLDSWTARTSSTDILLSWIAYGSGQFVAAGGWFDRQYPYSHGEVLTSADAVNWSPQPEQYPQLAGIAYGDGRFVAVGGDQDGWTLNFETTSLGVMWGPSTSWPLAPYFYAVTYGEGQFVTVGEFGSFVTSTNGINWAWPLCALNCSTLDPSLPLDPSLRGITYGNGQFVAVGDSGTIVTSADSTNWVQRHSGTTFGLNGIISGNGLFVVVGGYYSQTNNLLTQSIILTSTNGIDWIERPSATTNLLYAVAYGNSQFVAVGAFGTVLSSTDGINWTERQSGTHNHLSSICYGNGHFFAVGASGTILESGSIINLELKPNPANASVGLSLTGPSGLNYTIETSPDLVSWHALTNVISTQPTEIIFDPLPMAAGRAFYRAYSQ